MACRELLPVLEADEMLGEEDLADFG